MEPLNSPHTNSNTSDNNSSNNNDNYIYNDSIIYESIEPYCSIHKNEKIILTCLGCRMLVCKNCIVGHGCINGYGVIDIVKNNQLNEIKINELHLKGYLESDTFVKKSLDHCYDETVKKCNSNLYILQETSKKLARFFEANSKSIEALINTEQEANVNNYTFFCEEIKKNSDTIEEILKEDANSLLKDEKKLMDNKNKVNSLIREKNNRFIEPFTTTKLTINEDLIEQIKILSREVFTLTKEEYRDEAKDNVYKHHLMINKFFNPFLCQYYLSHGEPIPKHIGEVAFDSSYIHDKLIVPRHVKKISLYNGFKLPLDHIPEWINVLVVWDIVEPLKANSIPKSVGELYIRSGYNHLIPQGTIPSTVREVFICDITFPLLKNSLGCNVELLKIRNGYNHPITEGVIPPSVIALYFGKLGNSLNNIKTILTNDTIPKTGKLETIHFLADFNQSIPDNFIPKNRSITLQFYDIEQIKLFKNGVPSHVKNVILHNHIKYKHLILPCWISPSIKINYL
ncbi:hypothetical protein DICPUDRAFT_83274 [Dictyostelium purpureum]|uniref:B box-type domain-containing protein n=1 Tax=Dictyostelium purpureum TaxID=5786 RepID=F0ZZ27_DICPU|nr:uncharacterized protein DICPUDRAFT_83274 [Dictyostelium purpureum]EGC30801.1 hypothetical protein DICPUDRAFT_83274 [Dictyostelium purpureum]|eukprot:XP_003292668.1 hypothetical protein DICPUDRAFT_83274 [Dictyostelium purpureum]